MFESLLRVEHSVKPKSPAERQAGKHGNGLEEWPGCDNTLDRALDMRAIRTTRAAGNEAGDAPTTAQTHFDARDTITGDLDDTTVRQAAEEGL
jgi:hypothetical protein